MQYEEQQGTLRKKRLTHVVAGKSARRICYTLVALSRFLALCPAALFVVIDCGLDIRELLISFPNSSSVPLANLRAPSAL
jgi:hypothetical protein